MKSRPALLVLYFLLGFILLVQAQQRPNIVVFLVDDMGWMDTSVPFADRVHPLNKRYHTPNMERLARGGMKFTNAYATPVCTPSRVSMLTGMNAAHHGVTNWTMPFKDRNSDTPDEQLDVAPWNRNGLSPVAGVPHTVHATPLPQLLNEAGYMTIHVGKGHWATPGTPGANPYNLGFIVNVAGHVAGRPLSYLGEQNYGNNQGKPYDIHAVPDMAEYFGSDTYLTEAITREALKTLEAPIRNQQPFFLHLAHFALHDPYDPDKRYLQKYLDAGLSQTDAIYASMVEGMDKSLGDVMDYLEKKGVADNTILLFMSDNGGLSLAYAGRGEAHTQNLPLKAGKGSVYEGGIRVPMLVKWPGVVKPASVNPTPVIIEDFFPTILEMAQVGKYNLVQKVDGQSLVPMLTTPHKKPADRALIWHVPNKWTQEDGPGINYKSAIREGDWKLIYHQRDGKMELYNLKTDLGETTDLAAKHPKRVKALAAKLGQQLQAWEAPMPSFKSTSKPVPMPDEVLQSIN
ncbi:arylsulfatase A-like enzyme [Pontibacter mucosus]|uniref:Arylsulfatase A-like enzyme n=1 Tax=Pontibacter mucosus TaxID=1649266 RepID=A0A2T5YFH6_9BACT|nr:sulfatase [Pontibacter mucosus]PTX18063.1 arylsulfatase A-like enzyme [Pontibacter mucosus]